ncbi:Uncharacterized protein APZ42_002930, partial [Daphnia magna]
KALTEKKRERLFDEIQRQGLVLLHCRGQRGRDRPAQHPAGHPAGHEASRGRLAPQAGQGAGRWQPPAGAQDPGRGHRQGRRQGAGDLRRLHPGQGGARSPVPGHA